MKKIAALFTLLLCSATYAQDSKPTARTVDSDYTETKLWIKGLSCEDGKSNFIESTPEIVDIRFRNMSNECFIVITHKISYKLVGKSFHVITRLNHMTNVQKFVVEK